MNSKKRLSKLKENINPRSIESRVKVKMLSKLLNKSLTRLEMIYNILKNRPSRRNKTWLKN